MSDFAYFRFESLGLLTPEEKRNKGEMTSLMEEVMDAKGLECDARVAKMPEDEFIKILVEVRLQRL
jgi:hypothetical protein